MLFDLFAAAWIAAMLAFAAGARDRYAAAMQEDRLVEWWTAALFAIAGVVGLRRALRLRRWFDVLVALFCLFVAGEEVSWGQRLFGFTPPAPFLEHNTQQELNLHNFGDVFGRPKWALVIALTGYGLVLPALARWSRGAPLLRAVRATPPALGLAPWFAGAAVLLVWYPVSFTGEWVELLAGALFLAASGLGTGRYWASAGGALLAAAGLAAIGSRAGASDPAVIACARAEADALLHDLVEGGAVTPRLANVGSVHMRAWNAADDGYVDFGRLSRFARAACAEALPGAADRRRYAIDPWGTAYWVWTERRARGARPLHVYSFGPNRRRDGSARDTAAAARGDDVIAVGELRRASSPDGPQRLRP
ncbi:MAG TPA: hypothetical protein VNA89_15085 [Gemmatimonadaceae bacterium]|nr:hypothetical protein [Gemmatimonadaceae bacterium]